MRFSVVVAAVVLPTLFSVAGCRKKAEPEAKKATTAAAPVPPPTPVAVSPSREARRIFDTRCVVCHGDHGKGDGPGAAALNPKPRAFGDPTWQKSVDDAHIAKTIVDGGAAVQLSPGMAPNPDLQGKPEVVDELVKIVRHFGAT